MTYQVLARKWRPHDFESVVGQDHVVRALTHALRENRLHHAYIFTGTRGVGKTTLARILAKSLNCVGPDGHGGVTEHPCGQCEVCRAIDEGRFVDYIEMDAASNRGVDDMVDLLERAKYAPTHGRYKVYMIDEVHMLSTAAFNAMLKTLEEPPEYVKFILATTDPQKVPVTVLSRCLQFSLKNMTPDGIAAHMAHILEAEKIPAEPQALRLLAEGARGSMRDGLSLLDQAIAYSAGSVTLEGVRAMLGVIGSEVLVKLLEALARGDARSMAAIADEIGQRGLPYGQCLRDLASLLHRIAMAQRIPETVLDTDSEAADIRRLAQAFSPDELQLYYQISLHARADLSLAPDEYAGFTMALLRMLAFKPAGSAVGPISPAPLPRQPQPEPKAQPAAAKPSPAPVPQAAPAGVQPRQREKSPAAAAASPKPVAAAPKPAAPAPEPVPEAAAASMPPVSDDDPPFVFDAGEAAVQEPAPWEDMPEPPAAPAARLDGERWLGFVAGMKDGVAKALARECEFVCWYDGELTLKTDKTALVSHVAIDKLSSALSLELKGPARIQITEGTCSGHTVAAMELAANSQAVQQAREAFRADPAVQMLCKEFSGTPDLDSVRPRDAGGIKN